MPRERTGSIFKREKELANGKKQITWWARITYTDDVTKRRHDLQRRAQNKAHAKELLEKLQTDYDASGGKALIHERKTFEDLASHYDKNYLKPAEYVNGRKVSGLRSLDSPKTNLKLLREYFGKRSLRSITYGDIQSYKNLRFETPTNRELDKDGNPIGKRSIAAVNRELSTLNKMLNIAEREGWIITNPLKRGDTLISLADENQRERVLTREEEARLLEACKDERAYLRAILICALDTALRKNEMLSLSWSDIDFENEVITIRAFNSKTATKRLVPMTKRLKREIEKLYEQSQDKTETVFGIKGNIKRAFRTVCKNAKIYDFVLHDCRHTAITRMVALRLPGEEVMKISGHTQMKTFLRYLNPTNESLKRAAFALDSFHAQIEQTEIANELVN